MSDVSQFLWLVVIGTITGFIYAFGIGANDVANSFASTVSSKSLTLKQAVVVAGIFEFGGAILLGASVTDTIRNKIFDIKLYSNEPDIIVLGMTTSLMSAAAMLLIATYYGLPVSTTHTIVGCIMGFSICAKGFSSIDWTVVTKIFISWAASPLVSGLIGFIFFAAIRMFVLRHDGAFKRAYYTFPLVLLVGIGIDAFYIIYKGFNNFKWAKNLNVGVGIGIAIGIGAACAIVWLFAVGPVVMKRILSKRHARERLEVDVEKGGFSAGKAVEDEPAQEVEEVEEEIVVEDDAEYGDDGEMVSPSTKNVSAPRNVTSSSAPAEPVPVEKPLPAKSVTPVAAPQEEVSGNVFARASKRFADNTYGQDLHSQSMHENAKASELWDDAEMFDEDAEQLFTYVQVFTACLNSFAHGANDVSNAIAPISAIIYLYQDGELKPKSPVQKWILAYGGAGIVLGLLLYGYKVMKSLGFKVTALSPSRGASAELASSLFVVTASFLSIPVSSTQCITGAVTGVGLASGFKNVHWLFLLRVCVGWVMVFFVSVIVSAGVFSLLAFSPSLV